MAKRGRKKRFKVTTEIPTPDNFEGSELMNLFNPDNPDLKFFNSLDEEHIRLSGSKLFYYKFYRGEESYNDVYMEHKSKSISTQPIEVFGHYEPKVIEENLTQFGIELSNEQIFIFNKNYIQERLKREPIPGDVIKPKFQDMKFKLFEVQEDSFEIYGVYHYVCSAKILRDSKEVINTNIIDEPEDLGGYSRV